MVTCAILACNYFGRPVVVIACKNCTCNHSLIDVSVSESFLEIFTGFDRRIFVGSVEWFDDRLLIRMEEENS